MGSRAVGTRFGPYELQSVIGIGGMGEVYRAYDTQRERMVALKLLRPDMAADPSFQARFRRESRIAARLQEPHVIPVHDFGDIGGVLYIDMRLVEGPSLRDELRVHGVLAPARTVSIIAQVASALDAAHASGLVHRDIKPENVLLTKDDFAYLVDFGIAHGGGEATVTKTGLIIGSCAYMATERLNGQPGGPPSDVYSLTCLLFECLTGRPPFEAEDLRQVMSAHMFAPPPRGISPAFDAVVARGMAKNPGERFGSAGELARAAGGALQGGFVAAPAPQPARPPGTRQFTAAYSPAPQPPPRPAAVPAKRGRLSRTQMVLLFGTIGTLALAAGLALALVYTGGTGGSGPRSTLAVPPGSSSSSSTTTSSAAALAGLSGADAQGFVDHAARCDAGDSLVMAIRTASSLAVICETSSGSTYYHGERLRDGANLVADATPSGGGYDAVNPADGARYEVRPDRLTILSNGRVDSSEPALEFGER